MGLAGAAICALLALASCGDDDDATKEADASRDGGTLYVLRAGGGELRPPAEAGGSLRLTLRRVSPAVVAFSDRPQRSATTLGDSQLVRRWSELGFASDPPNAALEFAQGSDRRRVAVVEISNPTVDGSGLLGFHARLIDPTQASIGLARIAARARNDLTGQFGEATLFIDDAGGDPPTGSSCLDQCLEECAKNAGENEQQLQECVAECAAKCPPPEPGDRPRVPADRRQP